MASLTIKGKVKQPDISTTAKRAAYKKRAIAKLGKAKAEAHMKTLMAKQPKIKRTEKVVTKKTVTGKKKGKLTKGTTRKYKQITITAK